MLRRWSAKRRTAKGGPPPTGPGPSEPTEAPSKAVPSVTFLTRVGCSLCEQAQPVVEQVAREAGAALEVRDVDADPALREWSDHVPVVLLDGAVHSRWWVDPEELRHALHGR